MVKGIASLALSALAFSSVKADYTLTLVHTNDLHAHCEPTKIGDAHYGGYARQATLVKEAKKQSPNVLVLNGGDTFQGTLYFNVYLGLSDAALMNAIGYDAMCVGNHEFDRGPAVFADFVRSVSFPVLCANMDMSDEPSLAGKIPAWTSFERGGETIAVIGAVTPDLFDISSPGDKVKMKPLTESVQASIDEAESMGIDKVIVVSHCGYGLEKQMAADLDGVDVIVGGHSHTLLSSTTMPDRFPRGGPYPTVVKDKAGDTTLVVQAWEWGKVLGKIDVTFDGQGRVTKWEGAPIPVVESIPEDPMVASMVTALRKPIQDLMLKEVGNTAIEIPRGGPGQGAMADLICDAMLEATSAQGAVLAMMNAGGIRSGIDAGTITYGEAISVQPFNNTLVLLDLTGAEIQAVLSSGILFVSKGSSFTMADKSARDITIAGQPIDASKIYRCVVNSFIANGGDALAVLKEAKGRRYDTGLLDLDALLAYLKAHSPLNLQPEGRIKHGR